MSSIKAVRPKISVPQSTVELSRQRRSVTRGKLMKIFLDSLRVSPGLTLKVIFYIRDIEGRGERRIFNTAFTSSWGDQEDKRVELLNSQIFWELIVKYSSWKTVLDLALPMMEKVLVETEEKEEEYKLKVIETSSGLNIKLKIKINANKDNEKEKEKEKDKTNFNYLVLLELIKDTLRKDMSSRNPSLLAKWLPSEYKAHAVAYPNAFKALVSYISGQRGIAIYRKTLTSLRSKIGIVEQKMCANEWGKINYGDIPMNARKKYRRALKRHGVKPSKRRSKSEKVEIGKKKESNIPTIATDDVLSIKRVVEHNPRYTEVEELEAILRNN